MHSSAAKPPAPSASSSWLRCRRSGQRPLAGAARSLVQRTDSVALLKATELRHLPAGAVRVVHEDVGVVVAVKVGHERLRRVRLRPAGRSGQRRRRHVTAAMA